MRNDTRQAFNQYLARQAQLNGVDSAVQQFAVEPSVQQTLESQIQESSDFLNRVNIVGVDELKGDKIKLGVSGPIASRTDVSANDRQTTDVSSLDDDGYECVSTEYDTHIRWAQLDAWAKFRDFQLRLRNQILRRQALDRIMIGFNGTSAATPTDAGSNPLLQDVNIGWLQKYRDNAAPYVMEEGGTAGEVRVGPNGDYGNLDALVYDAAHSLIDPWFREAPGMVAICGRDLLTDKYLPLINDNEAPTERNALEVILSSKRLGGFQAAGVPYFPTNTILLTTFDNLSLYWQRGARRRYIIDEPKRNRVEHYDSSNDAYVVEEYGAGCLIENITIGDFSQ
ncbi:MAG: phage major capsid protein, P2 family [Salinisphaeraceae bacterium]